MIREPEAESDEERMPGPAPAGLGGQTKSVQSQKVGCLNKSLIMFGKGVGATLHINMCDGCLSILFWIFPGKL